jgi:hypothetical protein
VLIGARCGRAKKERKQPPTAARSARPHPVRDGWIGAAAASPSSRPRRIDRHRRLPLAPPPPTRRPPAAAGPRLPLNRRPASRGTATPSPQRQTQACEDGGAGEGGAGAGAGDRGDLEDDASFFNLEFAVPGDESATSDAEEERVDSTSPSTTSLLCPATRFHMLLLKLRKPRFPPRRRRTALRRCRCRSRRAGS